MNELGVIKKQITALQASYRDTADEPTRKAIQTQVKSLALELTEAGLRSSNPAERKASATASLLRQMHDAIMSKVEHMIAERTANALQWKGVHTSGVEYQPNDLVQCRGTIYVATKATTDKPGASDGWRLLVKTKGSNDDAE